MRKKCKKIPHCGNVCVCVRERERERESWLFELPLTNEWNLIY